MTTGTGNMMHCTVYLSQPTYFSSSNDLLCCSAVARAIAPMEVIPFRSRLNNMIEEKMSGINSCSYTPPHSSSTKPDIVLVELAILALIQMEYNH